MDGVSQRAVLRLRVCCKLQCSRMSSGTLLVIAIMHGSRPVSNMSTLQYRVFLSVVQRSSCSDGIMYLISTIGKDKGGNDFIHLMCKAHCNVLRDVGVLP